MIVDSAELRKTEQEKRKRKETEEREGGFLPRPPTFHIPFASSPLSESLERATGYIF